MRESEIERHLVMKAKWYGGHAIKFHAITTVGFPDRIVLLPGGRIAFVELKRPGEKPRKAQEWWLQTLVNLGFTALWFDNKQDIDSWLAEFSTK